MIHYHGTPVTPIDVLLTLAGKNFCVSHMRPDDIERVHRIGQSVMLDNGAFSKWKSGKETDWNKYYEWCDKWLDFPTTWAVIPDVIDAGSAVDTDSHIAKQDAVEGVVVRVEEVDLNAHFSILDDEIVKVDF